MPPSFKPTKSAVKAPTVKPPVAATAVEEDAVPSTPFQYEELNKPEPEPTGGLTPVGKAPRGWLWVFNRLQEPYGTPFDGHIEEFEANEFRCFPDATATFLAASSIFQIQGTTSIRALALEHRKHFGKPFPKGVTAHTAELIDRKSDPNPAGRGTGGVPTTAKLIHV